MTRYRKLYSKCKFGLLVMVDFCRIWLLCAHFAMILVASMVLWIEILCLRSVLAVLQFMINLSLVCTKNCIFPAVCGEKEICAYISAVSLDCTSKGMPLFQIIFFISKPVFVLDKIFRAAILLLEYFATDQQFAVRKKIFACFCSSFLNLCIKRNATS